MDMILGNHIDIFKTHLDEDGKTERAKKAYENDVKEYLSFLEGERKTLDEVGELEVRRYIKLLKEKHEISTIKRKTSAINGFYFALRKKGELLPNPFEWVKIKTTGNKQTGLDKEEIERLMSCTTRTRDRLIITLMKNSKIAPKDVINIKVKDVDLEREVIVLDKEVVRMDKDEIGEMNNYGVNEMDKEDFLFKSKNNNKVSETGLYYIIKLCLKKAGLDDRKPTDLTK